jgi:hypothetical protein
LIHKVGKKESVDLDISGTINDRVQAADWYKVANLIYTNK